MISPLKSYKVVLSEQGKKNIYDAKHYLAYRLTDKGGSGNIPLFDVEEIIGGD